jgi:hypothetical protein
VNFAGKWKRVNELQVKAPIKWKKQILCQSEDWRFSKKITIHKEFAGKLLFSAGKSEKLAGKQSIPVHKITKHS